MPAGTTAKRYAQAAFELAREQSKLEQWGEDLHALAIAFDDPGLRTVLKNPKLRLADKRNLVKQSIPGLGELALNLASLLTAQGRTGMAVAVAREYDRLVDSYKGIMEAQVLTAIPLEEQEKQEVLRSLKSLVSNELRLTSRVDPDILGGLVARIGDRLLDGSTRTRLEGMRKVLAGGGDRSQP